MVVAATFSTSATAEQISASDAIEKIESRDEATVSFVFSIYAGIFRANESLNSSHKPSIYYQTTIFVADGPNVIDIFREFRKSVPCVQTATDRRRDARRAGQCLSLPRLNWILTRPSASRRSRLGGGNLRYFHSEWTALPTSSSMTIRTAPVGQSKPATSSIAPATLCASICISLMTAAETSRN
jgi:hypothetical protein